MIRYLFNHQRQDGTVCLLPSKLFRFLRSCRADVCPNCNCFASCPLAVCFVSALIRALLLCCFAGGWGLHIECPTTMFGTVLTYCALRLLGKQSKAENACSYVSAAVLLHVGFVLVSRCFEHAQTTEGLAMISVVASGSESRFFCFVV